MARNDILPYTSSMGGHCRVEEYPLEAGADFLVGEPVYVNGAGQVEHSNDPAIVTEFTGIAATDGVEGTTLNFETGLALADGDMVKIYIPDFDQRWITPNYATGGAGVVVTPTIADVGLVIGLFENATNWTIDSGAATTNIIGRVLTILDADGADIARSGGTGTQVIFQLQRGLMQTASVPLDAGA